MFCHHCGNKVPDDASFCPSCGTNLNQNVEEEMPTTGSGDGPINENASTATIKKKSTSRKPILIGTSIVILVVAGIAMWTGLNEVLAKPALPKHTESITVPESDKQYTINRTEDFNTDGSYRSVQHEYVNCEDYTHDVTYTLYGTWKYEGSTQNGDIFKTHEEKTESTDNSEISQGDLTLLRPKNYRKSPEGLSATFQTHQNALNDKELAESLTLSISRYLADGTTEMVVLSTFDDSGNDDWINEDGSFQIKTDDNKRIFFSTPFEDDFDEDGFFALMEKAGRVRSSTWEIDESGNVITSDGSSTTTTTRTY